MRAIMLLVVVGACTPEIVSGAYLCGPEQTCPDGQACDGVTSTCVSAAQAKPFACGDELTEVEPNDTTPEPAPVLGCLSNIVEVDGCTDSATDADVFAVFVKAECTTATLIARVAISVAYGEVALTLANASNATVATAARCPNNTADDGDTDFCLTSPVAPGSYTLRVAQSGEADCEGSCAYNRYRLTFQLTQ